MNIPKMHDNLDVKNFLSDYFHAGALCEQFHKMDDIFSGVLELKTSGNTATRSLSRQVLFHILQCCEVINVESIKEATNGQYAYRTMTVYASTARVASKAIERFIAGLPKDTTTTTTRQDQQALDASYMVELELCQA